MLCLSLLHLYRQRQCDNVEDEKFLACVVGLIVKVSVQTLNALHLH